MNITDKTYSVIGVSELNGKFKVRYANCLGRAKVLERNGHTNVILIKLDKPCKKEDAVEAILNVDFGVEDANECLYAEARKFGFIV